jgi:hypothetical protein
LEGSGEGLIEELSWHLSGEVEELDKTNRQYSYIR